MLIQLIVFLRLLIIEELTVLIQLYILLFEHFLFSILFYTFIIIVFRYYDYSQYTYLVEFTEFNKLLLEKNEALVIKIAEEQKLIEESINILTPINDEKYKAIVHYTLKLAAASLFCVALMMSALATKT